MEGKVRWQYVGPLTWYCEMGGLAGLLGSSMGGVTDDGGGCCLIAVDGLIVRTLGASFVGVGGGETGDDDGNDVGQGVDALDDALRP